MQEEFHADNNGAKQLYGWGTINANIWLPSLSELVGIDTNNYHEPHGIYFSAMQGMNTSNAYCVDTKGGEQLAYFAQYNAAGGGETLWLACNQEPAWLRSPDFGQTRHVTRITDSSTINTYILPTTSHAVHPAVLLQAPFLLVYLKKQGERSLHCISFLLQSRLCGRRAYDKS